MTTIELSSVKKHDLDIDTDEHNNGVAAPSRTTAGIASPNLDPTGKTGVLSRVPETTQSFKTTELGNSQSQNVLSQLLKENQAEQNQFSQDILTVSAYQTKRHPKRKYDHAYGVVKGVDKNRLADQIRCKLLQLYPPGSSLGVVTLESLKARADKILVASDDHVLFSQKIVEPSMPLCLQHLSTRPESEIDFFINELVSIGGCDDGRDNQVLYAIYSTDSSFMFGRQAIDFIPSREGIIRREIFRLFKQAIGDNLFDTYDELKDFLQSRVVDGGELSSKSKVRLSENVFNALLPVFARRMSYQLPEIRDDLPVSKKLEVAQAHFNAGQSLEALGKHLNSYLICQLNNQLTLAELINHPDATDFIRDYPGRLAETDNSSATLLYSFLYEDPVHMLKKIIPYIETQLLSQPVAKGEKNQSLLHWAASGDVELFRVLHQRLTRENLLNWSALDSEGNTPLMTAVSARQVPIIDLMQQLGAPIDNRRNAEGKTVFSLSIPSEGDNWDLTNRLVLWAQEQNMAKPQLSNVNLIPLSLSGFAQRAYVDYLGTMLSAEQRTMIPLSNIIPASERLPQSLTTNRMGIDPINPTIGEEFGQIVRVVGWIIGFAGYFWLMGYLFNQPKYERNDDGSSKEYSKEYNAAILLSVVAGLCCCGPFCFGAIGTLPGSLIIDSYRR